MTRNDIDFDKDILNRHCPFNRDPPPSNGQGGPFSGHQKQHFSAYYRIKLKLIMVMKMMITMMVVVMVVVMILMIMVMKTAKKLDKFHGFSVKMYPF